MTTDQAATILADYQLTGSLSQTARNLKLNKAIVHRALKKAGAVTQPEPESLRNTKDKTDWAAAWGMREQKGLEIVDKRLGLEPGDAGAASFRDLSIWTGIASDKRYREEHPESVHGGAGQVIVPVQIVITQKADDAI